MQEFVGLPQIGRARRDADKTPDESGDGQSGVNPGNIAQQRVKDMMQMAANSLAETRNCRKSRLRTKGRDGRGQNELANGHQMALHAGLQC